MENTNYELKQQMDPMSDTLRVKLKTLGFEEVAFEPKVKNRFIATVDDIPSYLIKSVDLPSKNVYTQKNSSPISNWGSIGLTLYNPISHELEKQLLNLDVIKEYEIKVKILSPVGEVVSTWKIYGNLKGVEFDSLDWSSKGQASLAYLFFYVNSVVIE